MKESKKQEAQRKIDALMDKRSKISNVHRPGINKAKDKVDQAQREYDKVYEKYLEKIRPINTEIDKLYYRYLKPKESGKEQISQTPAKSSANKRSGKILKPNRNKPR